MEAFESRHSKRRFEDSTFFSRLCLRWMERSRPSDYVEPFYASKVVL